MLPQLSDAFGFLPAKEGGVDPAAGSIASRNTRKNIYDFATSSSTVLYNIFRYRLSEAFRYRPAPIYTILYRQMVASRDTQLFNFVVSKKKLRVEIDSHGTFLLKFDDPNAAKDIFIVLPKPEEFDNFQVAYPSNLFALYKLKGQVNRELYYHSLAPNRTPKKIEIERASMLLRKMAI